MGSNWRSAEEAVNEQLAGHLDEIDELKRRLVAMESALEVGASSVLLEKRFNRQNSPLPPCMRGQTQQQKIETESELNAFLDKRSYEVKDLREQLARHEAALEEARRTGEAATVAQSIKQVSHVFGSMLRTIRL